MGLGAAPRAVSRAYNVLSGLLVQPFLGGSLTLPGAESG